MTGPHQAYVSDITYIDTEQGFTYLTLITDAYSRYIVGSAVSDSLATAGSLQALNRALAHRPSVIVADEPTGNLDSRTGAAVIELLDELRRSEGAALLLATHDVRVAAAAGRVCELADGRLVG